MSNWCENNLIITGLTGAETAALEVWCEDYQTSRIFLEKLIATPPGCDKQEWRRENWGVNEDLINLTYCRTPEGALYLNFSTACEPPLAAINTLCTRYPHATFFLYYWEPDADIAGRYTVSNSKSLEVIADYYLIKEEWIKKEHPHLFEGYQNDEEDAIRQLEDLWDEAEYSYMIQTLDQYAEAECTLSLSLPPST